MARDGLYASLVAEQPALLWPFGTHISSETLAPKADGARPTPLGRQILESQSAMRLVAVTGGLSDEHRSGRTRAFP